MHALGQCLPLAERGAGTLGTGQASVSARSFGSLRVGWFELLHSMTASGRQSVFAGWLKDYQSLCVPTSQLHCLL